MENEIIKVGRPEEIIEPSEASERIATILAELEAKSNLTAADKEEAQLKLNKLMRFVTDDKELKEFQSRLEAILGN